MAFDIRKSMKVDVAAVEDAGRRVPLRDHTGAPLLGDDGEPVTALIAGTYSTRFLKAKAAQRDRLVRQRGAGMTGDSIETQAIELDAACVVEWDLRDGAMMADPKAVLRDFPWLREQVVEVANEHARFSSGS